MQRGERDLRGADQEEVVRRVERVDLLAVARGRSRCRRAPPRARAPAESSAGSPCRSFASEYCDEGQVQPDEVAVEVGEARARRARAALHVDQRAREREVVARLEVELRLGSPTTTMTASSSRLPSGGRRVRDVRELEQQAVELAPRPRRAARRAPRGRVPSSRAACACSSAASRPARFWPRRSPGRRGCARRAARRPAVCSERRCSSSAIASSSDPVGIAPRERRADALGVGCGSGGASSTPDPSGQFTSRCGQRRARSRNCATPSSCTERETQSACRASALVGVRDADAEAGPLEQLASFSPSPKETHCAAVNPSARRERDAPTTSRRRARRTRGRYGSDFAMNARSPNRAASRRAAGSARLARRR